MIVKLVLVMIFGLLTIVVSDVPRALGQLTPTRTNVRQTETLLIRIETKIDVLKEEAQRVADRNTNSATPNQIGEYLSTLEQSVTKLHGTLNNRGSITSDLTDALTNATLIDQYLVKNRVNASAQSQWRSLKTDFTSLATANNINWDWNQPITPVNVPADTLFPTTESYTVPATQVRTLLSRVDLKTKNFKTQINTALSASTPGDQPDALSGYVTGFETAARRLQQQFESSKSTSADAVEVLKRATYIDQFMSRNRLNSQTQAQWRNLKSDLNTLATYYNVTWNWNQKLPSETTGPSDTGIDSRNFDAALTGTY